ncbi:MAG: hypothetical protein WD712_02945 [Candidatus Spechtbacterales bacterium]
MHKSEKVYAKSPNLSDELVDIAHGLGWLNGVEANANIFDISVNEEIAKQINQKLKEAYSIIALL